MLFETISAGDTVLVRTSIKYGPVKENRSVDTIEERIVERVTATQFFIRTGERFYRTTGGECGGLGYAFPVGYLYGDKPVTATTLEEYHRIEDGMHAGRRVEILHYILGREIGSFYLSVRDPNMLKAVLKLEKALNDYRAAAAASNMKTGHRR